MNVEGIDRRGSTVLTVGSNGPGTSTKYVDLLIRGYEAIKSPRAVKLSAAQRRQPQIHPTLVHWSRITLILLGVPNARWGDVTRREIPTEHNHFRNEVHFYTVVKHFSDPPQRGGVIQPHVRENKEVEVGKLLFDPNYISRLDDCRLSTVKTHQMEDCVRLPAVSSPPSLGSLCDRKWIWT